MKIGFDLDGVLCEISMIDLVMLHKHDDDQDLLYYLERATLLDPKSIMHENDQAVCVTARPSRFHAITDRWMAKYHPSIPVYYFKTDLQWFEREKVAQAKIDLLRDLQVCVYVDDDPDIIKIMRELAKDILFIQYGGRLS